MEVYRPDSAEVPMARLDGNVIALSNHKVYSQGDRQ